MNESVAKFVGKKVEPEDYTAQARTALFCSQKTGAVILNGAERSEESLCVGSGEERFFAALRMTGKAQFLASQSIYTSSSHLPNRLFCQFLQRRAEAGSFIHRQHTNEMVQAGVLKPFDR